MKLYGVVAATIYLGATCSSAVAQSTDDILRRLEALEKSESDLKKENAALRDRLKRIETAKQTMPVIPAASSATKPTDAYAAATGPVYKAMPYGVPAVRNWTGFYAGAHGGF